MSISAAALRDEAADYGLVDLSAEGARAYLRIVERPFGGRIESPAHYVGACLRLARRIGGSVAPVTVQGAYDYDSGEYASRLALLSEGWPVDNRLVAVGFRHETPSAWIREGRLWRFLAYYRRATMRDRPPGSPYNQTPERVYAAWRSGVPASAVRLHLWRSDRIRPLRRRELVRLRRAVRAAGRTSVSRERGLGLPERITPAALSQLGRLSSELQRELIRVSGGLPDTRAQGWRPLACRDLRWDLLVPIHRALAADRTGRVRAAMARGRRFVQLVELHLPEACRGYARDVLDRCATDLDYAASIGWGRAVAAWLAPSFPGVSIAQAQRLCLGESPVTLSGGQLSAKEAHRWLSEAPDREPIEWLQAQLGHPEVPPLRDIVVVRWLADVQRRGSWDQLTRTRRFHGPAALEGECRYLDRIDEILPEDLARGVATRVEDAFRAAAERHGEAWLAKAREDHRVLCSAPSWQLFPRSMRCLRTAAQLAREGDEMGHCVGGYAPTVADGRSVILALRIGDLRSTAELTKEGRVLQHRGPRNEAPEPALKRLLERFLERNGLRR